MADMAVPTITQRKDGCVAIDYYDCPSFFQAGRGPFVVLSPEQWLGLWHALMKLNS